MRSKIVPFPRRRVNTAPVREVVTASRREWIQGQIRKLGPTAMHVWLLLGLYARRQANGFSECWPSVKRVSADSGLSDATVKRAIAALKDAGWIRVVRTQMGNRYRLCDIAPDPGRMFATFIGKD